MDKNSIEYKIDFILNLIKNGSIKHKDAVSSLGNIQNNDDNIDWNEAFLKLSVWFSAFSNKDRAFSVFSRFIKKQKNKKEFLELFLSSPNLRGSLIYIFSYPYLETLLFDDINAINSIFKDERKDSLGSDRENKFYNKRYLLRSLQAFFSYSNIKDSIRNLSYMQVLRFKRREILRIAILKSMGTYSIEDVGKALSLLADFIFSLALKKALLSMKNMNMAVSKRHFAILALDRFALRTVLYTDTYNILFIYEEQANTKEGENKNLAYNYYNVLVQRIVDFICPRRGDTIYNLSFYKGSKRSHYPLIYTTSQYIERLENKKTTVDRHTLMNIRFLAGDFSTSENFINLIIPIVYQKYISFREVSEYKDLISNILKSFDKTPLKTIEQILNLFSLFTKKDDKKKLTDTLYGITFLFSSNDLIKAEDKEIIKKSYIFFKELKYQRELLNLKDWSFFFDNFDKIEENKFAVYNILSNLDIEDKDNLKETLLSNFEQMIQNTKSILRKYIKDITYNKYYLLFLLYDKESYKGMEEILLNYGFDDPKLASSLLQEIAPYSEKGKESFADSLLLFLKIISTNKSLRIEADLLLVSLSKLIQSYKAKDTLLELLAYHPFLLNHLLLLFGNSTFLSEIIIRHLEFLEYLADSDFLSTSSSTCELDRLLCKCLKVMSFKESISYLKELESIRIGMKQILALKSIKEIGYDLSCLAEFILIRSFEYFYDENSKKLGYNALDYSIILLGKFGGREMSFGSDLDIYFVYEKKIDIRPDYDNTLFYSDILEKLNHFFTHPPFTTGNLYKLDFKLRPEGRNAPIIVSFNKMQDYLLKASKDLLWLRLAHTKARVISKNAVFKSKIRRLIDDFIFSKRELSDKEIKKEVIDMRLRIANNSLKKRSSAYLFKKGRGGLLDIEFLAQYLIISKIKQITDPSLASIPKNIFSMIETLHKANIISYENYIFIEDALFFLKRIETTLRINTNTPTEELLHKDTKALMKIAYKCNFENIDIFLRHCKETSKRVEDIFNKVLLS